MKHVIVGTAGHIDHGKSTLVEALTGTHPDRLEEEKRRGITIDLGFAFLELSGVRFGFVDVPGHERFVRNMLAGVGGIDIVLLVVAADESVKPQTREHFDICRLLQIPRGIIALSKADLLDSEMQGLARLEAEELVRGSFLEGAPIVSVSARTGQGLPELQQALLRVAQAVPGRDSGRYFRLPIDRAFAVRGFGTVVTGTLVEGSVKVEDEAELLPAQRRVRVRGLHSAGAAEKQAQAGQRTAVNLAGIELNEISRGMVLAAPGRFRPTQRLDARVTLLGSARTLKNRARIHFHQGTAESIAEVLLLGGREQLQAGQSAYAQLRIREPVVTAPGDRFILRQFSPVVTIGGGVVLDSLAPRHRKSDGQVQPLLEAFERGDLAAILQQLAEGEPKGIELEALVARSGRAESDLQEVAQEMSRQNVLRVVCQQPWIIAAESAVQDLGRRIRQAVEEFHKTSPLAPGLPKEELRGRVAAKHRPEVFRAALEDLLASNALEISGDLVRRAGREIALTLEESQAKAQIEREFERAALSVPRFADVLANLPVDAKRAQKILQLLLREKVLVKISAELIFHRSAVAHLRELVAGYKKQQGERLRVAAFKQLTGVSRKYAIPLLEYLDRERVTRRAGDERVIL